MATKRHIQAGGAARKTHPTDSRCHHHRCPHHASDRQDVPPTVGTPEGRLQRVEQELAELPGRTKKDIEAVEAAIDEKLAALDATGKAFAVRDIYCALGGIGIGMVGTLLSLIAQLSS